MACINGHVAVAQWLAAHFDLTREDACAGNNSALLWTCSKGNLATAQWLVDHFGLTAADVCADGNFALHAQANGHTHIIAWLRDKLGVN